MTIECIYCSRSFTRRANLLRHVSTLHPNVSAPKEDDSEEDPEIDSDDELDTESQISNQDDDLQSNSSMSTNENIDEELENEYQPSESEDSDSDSEDEDSSDTESLTGSDYWGNMICTAAKSVDHDETEDLLHEPQLNEMVNAIRKIVQKNIKFANYMEHEDDIVDQIGKAVERHENDGADKDAAEEAGWLDKRVLIKRKIQKHLDELEYIPDDEDGDDVPLAGEDDDETEATDPDLNDIIPHQF